MTPRERAIAITLGIGINGEDDVRISVQHLLEILSEEDPDGAAIRQVVGVIEAGIVADREQVATEDIDRRGDLLRQKEDAARRSEKAHAASLAAPHADDDPWPCPIIGCSSPVEPKLMIGPVKVYLCAEHRGEFLGQHVDVATWVRAKNRGKTA